MTKRRPIPAPHLYRPTLPYKKAIEGRVRCKPERLGEYVNLARRGDSLPSECLEPTPAMLTIPEAVLVTESLDEQRQRGDSTSSTRSSFSLESRCDADNKQMLIPLNHPTTTKYSGVYYENVEVEADVHPLQSCFAQEGALSSAPVRRTVSLARGVPLAAAPKLPTRRQQLSSLRPLPCPASLKRPAPSSVGQNSNKMQRLGVPQEWRQPPKLTTDRLTSRAAEVKEASFMIEAAVALSKLHCAKAN